MNFQQEMLGRTRKKSFFIFRTQTLLPKKKEKKYTFLEMGADGGLAKRKVSSGKGSKKERFFKGFFFSGIPGVGSSLANWVLCLQSAKRMTTAFSPDFSVFGKGEFSVSRSDCFSSNDESEGRGKHQGFTAKNIIFSELLSSPKIETKLWFFIFIFWVCNSASFHAPSSGPLIFGFGSRL